MKIAIMQPTYLPWLGYFDLIDQVDTFIFLDNVQFAKRSWQQRNRIKTPSGLDWLTVPVNVSGRYHQKITEVHFSANNFVDKHIGEIRHNYVGTQCFNEYFYRFSEEAHRLVASGRLVDLNCGLIAFFCRELGIKTKLVRASDLGIDGRRSDLLASLCQAVEGQLYVSALGSSSYLIEDLQEFRDRDLDVEFQHYEHPIYRQEFPPFLPQACILDLLLNEGQRSFNILQSGRRSNYSVKEAKNLLITPNHESI